MNRYEVKLEQIVIEEVTFIVYAENEEEAIEDIKGGYCDGTEDSKTVQQKSRVLDYGSAKCRNLS